MTNSTKLTPGQALLARLYRAESYDNEAKKIAVPAIESRLDPNLAARRWCEGMSNDAKRRFSEGVRELREKLGLTQQRLAEMADLTSTAVAMIERGERAPSLDTATRLCWALDVAAGVTIKDLA